MDQKEYLRELEINNPYGKPSDSIRVYNLGDIDIVIFPWHHRINILNTSKISCKA